MGIVWRAVDERLERSVAVKQILAQPGLSDAERDNIRQRAMREARNAARFQHPNAIVVFDIAEHEGDPCLVMEYLPSRSLSAILAERGTLPVPEIARIGEQVASALVAAHRAGIVHRDIKPGNVLIDDNGLTKITDFGISRATGDLTLTQTGLIGGTPAYLAPELARGADPAPSSDVFALGATLYHAIEGLPPYGDSTNQLALLYAAASGKINPPTRAGSATALLMSLLRPEPEDRPTMAEAREKLAALATEGNGRAAGGPAVTRVSPPLPPQGGGPRPAAPPWQRDDRGEAVPPRNPTANFAPARNGNGSGGSASKVGGGRRKPLLFGAVGAAVLVLAAVLVILLNQGGDDPGGNVAGGDPSSASPTQSEPSSSAPADLGQTENEGTVTDFAGAGQLVVGYYNDPQGSWNRLTPAAQALFGGEDEYRTYWSGKSVQNIQNARAYKGTNNEDGSVDMRVYVDFGDGLRPMYLRVINSASGMLIDSDPRPESNSQR